MTQVGWMDLPLPLRAAVVVLGAVQIAVEVVALVALARTPVDRVRFGKKWPWVLVILLVNLVGAIVFLAVGRLPVADAADAGPPAASGESMARAVEVLYGREEKRRDA